jgi:hypothetical protein
MHTKIAQDELLRQAKYLEKDSWKIAKEQDESCSFK